MNRKRKIKVEMVYTKDLKDRMIVFVPHDMNVSEWPDPFESTGIKEILKETTT